MSVEARDEDLMSRPRSMIRFGTRSLFLLTGVVALILLVEVRRLNHQRRLADSIEGLGGSYQRSSRDVPSWLLTWLGDELGTRLDNVHLYAPLFPDNSGAPFKLILPTELATFLQMPAMKEVTSLSILGETVTDDVIDDLRRLDALTSLELTDTPLLTPEGIAKLRRELPRCKVVVYISDNYPEYVNKFAKLSRDVTLFDRAQRGQLNAVEQLVALVAEHYDAQTDEEHYDKVVDLLRTTPNEQAVELLRQRLNDDDPKVRLLIVKVLGARGESEHMAAAIRDVDPGVCIEAIYQATHLLDAEALLPVLLRACQMPNPAVRYEAVLSLGVFSRAIAR